LIETYNLTQYDSGSSGGGNTGNGNGSTNNQETAINQQFRTTAALNIRSDASTSASITGSLANNATFQAVASKTGTSVNGNTTWYRINGRGWVSAAYVTAVNNNQNNNQNNQETTINQQFRTTATLNIRNQPTIPYDGGLECSGRRFYVCADHRVTGTGSDDPSHRPQNRHQCQWQHYLVSHQ